MSVSTASPANPGEPGRGKERFLTYQREGNSGKDVNGKTSGKMSQRDRDTQREREKARAARQSQIGSGVSPVIATEVLPLFPVPTSTADGSDSTADRIRQAFGDFDQTRSFINSVANGSSTEKLTVPNSARLGYDNPDDFEIAERKKRASSASSSRSHHSHHRHRHDDSRDRHEKDSRRASRHSSGSSSHSPNHAKHKEERRKEKEARHKEDAQKGEERKGVVNKKNLPPPGDQTKTPEMVNGRHSSSTSSTNPLPASTTSASTIDESSIQRIIHEMKNLTAFPAGLISPLTSPSQRDLSSSTSLPSSVSIASTLPFVTPIDDGGEQDMDLSDSEEGEIHDQRPPLLPLPELSTGFTPALPPKRGQPLLPLPDLHSKLRNSPVVNGIKAIGINYASPEKSFEPEKNPRKREEFWPSPHRLPVLPVLSVPMVSPLPPSPAPEIEEMPLVNGEHEENRGKNGELEEERGRTPVTMNGVHEESRERTPVKAPGKVDLFSQYGLDMSESEESSEAETEAETTTTDTETAIPEPVMDEPAQPEPVVPDPVEPEPAPVEPPPAEIPDQPAMSEPVVTQNPVVDEPELVPIFAARFDQPVVSQIPPSPPSSPPSSSDQISWNLSDFLTKATKGMVSKSAAASPAPVPPVSPAPVVEEPKAVDEVDKAKVTPRRSVTPGLLPMPDAYAQLSSQEPESSHNGSFIGQVTPLSGSLTDDVNETTSMTSRSPSPVKPAALSATAAFLRHSLAAATPPSIPLPQKPATPIPESSPEKNPPKKKSIKSRRKSSSKDPKKKIVKPTTKNKKDRIAAELFDDSDKEENAKNEKPVKGNKSKPTKENAAPVVGEVEIPAPEAEKPKRTVLKIKPQSECRHLERNHFTVQFALSLIDRLPSRNKVQKPTEDLEKAPETALSLEESPKNAVSVERSPQTSGTLRLKLPVKAKTPPKPDEEVVENPKRQKSVEVQEKSKRKKPDEISARIPENLDLKKKAPKKSKARKNEAPEDLSIKGAAQLAELEPGEIPLSAGFATTAPTLMVTTPEKKSVGKSEKQPLQENRKDLSVEKGKKTRKASVSSSDTSIESEPKKTKAKRKGVDKETELEAAKPVEEPVAKKPKSAEKKTSVLDTLLTKRLNGTITKRKEDVEEGEVVSNGKKMAVEVEFGKKVPPSRTQPDRIEPPAVTAPSVSPRPKPIEKPAAPPPEPAIPSEPSIPPEQLWTKILSSLPPLDLTLNFDHQRTLARALKGEADRLDQKDTSGKRSAIYLQSIVHFALMARSAEGTPGHIGVYQSTSNMLNMCRPPTKLPDNAHLLVRVTKYLHNRASAIFSMKIYSFNQDKTIKCGRDFEAQKKSLKAAQNAPVSKSPSPSPGTTSSPYSVGSTGSGSDKFPASSGSSNSDHSALYPLLVDYQSLSWPLTLAYYYWNKSKEVLTELKEGNPILGQFDDWLQKTAPLNLDGSIEQLAQHLYAALWVLRELPQ